MSKNIIQYNNNEKLNFIIKNDNIKYIIFVITYHIIKGYKVNLSYLI